jgi:hypothetical protein
MKNTILLTVALAGFFSATVCAQVDTINKGFRDAFWGMSKTKVKTTEKSNLIKEEESRLTYRTMLANLNTDILYSFDNDAFVKAQYVIAQKYLDLYSYCDDYKMFQELLTAKYGTPVKANADNDDSSIVRKIQAGTIAIEDKWETKKLQISLMLTKAEDGTVVMEIEYVSKEYMEKVNKERKEKLLQVL